MTPVRYVQEGETLRLIVMYHWWRNLLGEATVRVLLRGQMRTGITEVLPEEDGEVVVKVHLTGPGNSGNGPGNSGNGPGNSGNG